MYYIDYGGLSIGVPLREGNFSLTLQNNFYFTSIIAANKLLMRFGMTLGGYPPMSTKTEQDN
jgi:hypothetical protein